MSNYGSDFTDDDLDDEPRQARVVWRTAPAQKAAPQASTSACRLSTTPKAKRTTKTAGLASPSASGSTQGEPALREAKKNRVQKKKKTPFARAVAPRHEEPMDTTTLRLVSQLAMKVQARSQPVRHAPTTAATSKVERARSWHETRPIGDGPKSRTTAGRQGDRTPLVPKVNRPQSTPPSDRGTLKSGFSSSKASVSHAPTKVLRPAPSPLRPLRSAPASDIAPCSRSVDLPHPTGARVDVDKVSLDKDGREAEEDEEDFDSYFDDFAADESFELALSQIETLETSKRALSKSATRDDLQDDSAERANAKPDERSARDKQRQTEELARKEIESLGHISDWGSDDDF